MSYETLLALAEEAGITWEVLGRYNEYLYRNYDAETAAEFAAKDFRLL